MASSADARHTRTRSEPIMEEPPLFLLISCWMKLYAQSARFRRLIAWSNRRVAGSIGERVEAFSKSRFSHRQQFRNDAPNEQPLLWLKAAGGAGREGLLLSLAADETDDGGSRRGA